MAIAYNSVYAYDSILTYVGEFYVTPTGGTTFTAELNRLANGGLSYPAMTLFRNDQGAANSWAGTSGLGLLAALNIKANASRTPNNYKGLNAVCNELASTTGLSARDALRNIE